MLSSCYDRYALELRNHSPHCYAIRSQSCMCMCRCRVCVVCIQLPRSMPVTQLYCNYNYDTIYYQSRDRYSRVIDRLRSNHHHATHTQEEEHTPRYERREHFLEATHSLVTSRSSLLTATHPRASTLWPLALGLVVSLLSIVPLTIYQSSIYHLFICSWSLSINHYSLPR